MLLELSKTWGSEPALLGLLQVFKEYYPDVIVGQNAAGRFSKFSYPDPEWRERLRSIHDANSHSNEIGKFQASGFRILRMGSKRRRVSVVPEVHTYHAEEVT